MLILILALLFGAVGSARAAGSSWLPAQRIEPGQASINGLSCASSTTCLAASTIPVVQDGGPSFEPSPDPDPLAPSLNAVSCAPGTRFCMFVDNNGGAFSYGNGNFGSLADIDGNIGIESVSCPSSVFCVAIDDNNKVFKYSNGAWDAGTQLSTGTHTFNMTFVNVSCASSSFCIALANTSDGELYYTWNGTTWSSAGGPFDASGGHTISLSCTSTIFCLETDEAGYASLFNGSTWSTPHRVDSYNATPQLHSSCVGTSCVAVDFYDNFYQSGDGSTWTTAVNIHADTLIAGVESLACATATLCVAGDGVGDATTYAVPPAPGTPSLAGTPTVGQTLTLTHASVQAPNVWYYDDWRRCENPDATCTLDPISTSNSGYTLVGADANEYIDAREFFGFGFDQEGPIISNIVGPIGGGTSGTGGTGGTGGTEGTTTLGTAKLSGAASTTRAGVVTIALRCTGGPCHGKVKLTMGGTIGSAVYSAAAGQSAKIKIKLTAAGKKQLEKHKGGLTVKLVITPTGGTPTSAKLMLKVER